MAGTTFKKRDLNRFRKVYPYIRKKPVFSLLADSSGEVVMEAASVAFSDESGPVEHVFVEAFSSAPSVTATAVDSESNNSANINIFIKSISTTAVSFESSEAFTGTVSFQAILIT